MEQTGKDAGAAKRILLVDCQQYWRERSKQALEEAGFEVEVLSHYDYTPREGGAPPDLVILGCASIGENEQRLIGHLLANKLHLLVLCTSLPWRVMRALFLAGADDVAEKPYDPSHLLSAVQHAFKSITPR
jgi:DNA-binding response OmpR family regulator